GRRSALEALGLLEAARWPVAGHEGGVPVPVVPPVLLETEVARQAADVGGAGTVGEVGGDGVGGLLERGEASVVAAHEAADPLPPAGIHPRGDVDEHQGGAGGSGRLPGGEERGEPPE